MPAHQTLRSRSKPEHSQAQFPLLNRLEDSYHTDEQDKDNPKIPQITRRNTRLNTKAIFTIPLVLVLLIFGAYTHLKPRNDSEQGALSATPDTMAQHPPPRPSPQGIRFRLNLKDKPAPTTRPTTNDTNSTTWHDTEPSTPRDRNTTSTQPIPIRKYPKVDRAVLKKLDRMHAFYEQKYGAETALDSESEIPTTPPPEKWRPLVTHVPERPHPTINSRRAQSHSALCDSGSTQHCRFLLPLRIAEHGPNARLQIVQLAQLAAKLNRTLVLPNVGKGKLSVCGRWEFGAYYDLRSLPDASDMGGPGVGGRGYIGLEAFKTWVQSRDHGAARGPVRAQFVSVASALPARVRFQQKAIYANQEVEVHGYDEYSAWDDDLPKCLSSKFQMMELEGIPAYFSIMDDGQGAVSLPGDSIVDAVSAVLSTRNGRPVRPTQDAQRPEAIERGLAPEPQVLMINWDLRQPIFPSLPSNQILEYSPRMRNLANRFSPANPYLVIHWAIASIDPNSLFDCAHQLVDVLSRILHDETLSRDISTIWLASDYPYPIARGSKKQRSTRVAGRRSDFRGLNVLHEEAIEFLLRAFDDGELRQWNLTGFPGTSENEVRGAEGDLLHDSGVLSILDKLISMKAALFVSGSKRCSKRSSFVVEARHNEWSASADPHSEM